MAIIGTMRAEEARVFDSEAGYHSFHNEEGAAYGSLEVFWSEDYAGAENNEDGGALRPGWYWWACSPGCMPDGEPEGPFATSWKARDAADEFWPEGSNVE